jgi:hypothetical protein
MSKITRRSRKEKETENRKHENRDRNQTENEKTNETEIYDLDIAGVILFYRTHHVSLRVLWYLNYTN